jgi:uncharacterized protein
VARDERKLRIEVGYGLEDRLTDAQSSVIIHQVITPSFKAGHFSKGISDGVAAMLVVLGGNALDEPSTAYESRGDPGDDFVSRHPGIFVFLVLLFILTVFVCQMLGILPAGRGGSGGRRRFRRWRFWRRWRRGLQRRRGQFRGRWFVGRLVIKQ